MRIFNCTVNNKNMFSPITDRLLIIVNEFQEVLYIIIGVCLLVYGVMAMTSEEFGEKLKKRAPLFIIGAVVAFAAVTLGANAGAKLKF